MAIAVPDDYIDFCGGILRLVGIDLSQYKRPQMERRLRTFAERRGKEKLSDYLGVLKTDQSELEAFLDRMTINVSQLWRNPERWEAMAKTLLPQLAKTGRIRIWSAGCSYGAEAYTIAAVCREVVPGTRVEVVGTDVDARMVERAQTGVFSEEDTRTVPAASLDRWFDREGNTWTAKTDLKRLVKFERGDLLAMRFPQSAYDLVLCRNVVIYFTEDVRDELHRRLASSLRPGGFMVVGSTERVAIAGEVGLELTSPFTYWKA
jgi:chemotaxis protein methyltransferase CheR